MNKQEFMDTLRKALYGLPCEDIEERLNFYSEMIDDKMEDGLSECDAVSEIGDVYELASQIKAEIPLAKLVKEKVKPKRKLSALEIVLIVLGSPVWLSLIIAALAIIFALYVSLWSIVVCLWAVFASLAACTFVGLAHTVIFAFLGHTAYGLYMLGAGLILAGLTIFAFFGCRLATKSIVWLTKKIFMGIKNCFMRKGGSTNE